MGLGAIAWVEGRLSLRMVGWRHLITATGRNRPKADAKAIHSRTYEEGLAYKGFIGLFGELSSIAMRPGGHCEPHARCMG